MIRAHDASVRILHGLLALTLAVLVAGEASAGSRDARALLRCRAGLTRAGVQYAHRLEWRLVSCLSQLQECAASGRSSCRTPGWSCGSLRASVTGLEDELRFRIVASCNSVRLADLRGELGFEAALAGCTVNSLSDFVRCVAGNVRRAEGKLFAQIDPTACSVFAANGLGDVLPASACTSDGGPPLSTPSGPLACGGPADLACPNGFACDRTDPLCTQDGMSGRCVELTTACAAPATPTCGCDGQTYASACARLTAGVVELHAGACDPAPQTCGPGNPPCPDGAYCEFPLGDCGEGGVGVCSPTRSDACETCSAFVVQGAVCGCNLTTFSSECERIAAGVSGWFRGSCQ